MRNAEAKFLICEDVRSELNGKLTLTGVYPGDIILLNKLPSATVVPEQFISILPRLAIVVFIRGATGRAKLGQAVVTAPSGTAIIRGSLGEFAFDNKKPATIIVQTGPVGLPEIGTYRAEFSFDETKYSFTFEVQAAPDFVFAKKAGVTKSSAPPKKQQRSTRRVPRGVTKG
jgi:hypothetical protein